jgi:hypothetical protein
VKARAPLGRAAALGLCSLWACGYALQGRGMSVDPSIKRIGVPTFRDKTGRPGLDQKVTQKVIEELLKRGRFDVVSASAGVDALVEGELTGYNVSPVGFSQAQDQTTQATRYVVSLTARVTYSKVGQSEPIWESAGFVFRDEYDLGENPQLYFDREDQTVDRITGAFARSLVQAMLEGF